MSEPSNGNISADVAILLKWQKSPSLFVRDIWKLEVVKDGEEFVMGKHITKQQEELLEAVGKAVRGEASPRISVRAGKGVGKSCSLSWILLWFLFCYEESQVPCTAPTGDQLYDVLWKECSRWIARMPDNIKEQYEWQSSYIRIKDRPAEWFARARTAKKEAPEALAGVHSPTGVMCLVDEASGVDDAIFKMAEGSLTGKLVLMIMISNPTRTSGYFYESHKGEDASEWQKLHFNSLDSPVVDKKYIERTIFKYGEDSDDYRVTVLGEFPREDAIDAKGYVPLITEDMMNYTTEDKFVGRCYMGVDPSGEGDDETVWVVRDKFKARIVASEKVSTAKGIAQKTMTLMDLFEIPGDRVTVDNFGIGANVVAEMGGVGMYVLGKNVGDKADDDDRYANKRAEAFYRMREWLKKGGLLYVSEEWKELLNLKFRRNERGKIQIMGKLEMRGMGIASPNKADALMLSFCEDGDDEYYSVTTGWGESEGEKDDEGFDRFSVV